MTLRPPCKRWRGISQVCKNAPWRRFGPRDAGKGQDQAAPGRLIGYARVSTEEQGTDPQLDELRDAGCLTIQEEHASGADRSRPVLARLLREIRPAETLVVVRLDRLAGVR